MDNLDLTGAPAALRALAAQLQTELAGTYPPDQIPGVLARMIQHAGFFKTPDGWKRLRPDMRERINVRPAVAQADGRYLVQDVDIFYPNAAKSVEGMPVQHTAKDIARYIQNSNAAVDAGSVIPVTRVHVVKQQQDSGVNVPGCGNAMSFRPSPRGEGWARCDLLVDRDAVDDWRANKITGLSVGLTADANGTNKRFGHVAALGGAPAALSRLPATEIAAVYSANSHNYLCFSADAESFPVSRNPQNKDFTMTPEQIAQGKQCVGALHAAYAAMEAGEPDAETKIQQAHTDFCNYAGVSPAEGEHNDAAQDKALIDAELAKKTGAGAAPAPQPEPTPAYAQAPGDEDEKQFAAALETSTGPALLSLYRGIRALAKQVGGLAQKDQKNEAKSARDNYAAFVGQHFTTDSDNFAAAMKDYDEVDGNAKAVAVFKRNIGKQPTIPANSPAAFGQVFSSVGDGPLPVAKPTKTPMNAAARIAGAIGRTATAADCNFAADCNI